MIDLDVATRATSFVQTVLPLVRHGRFVAASDRDMGRLRASALPVPPSLHTWYTTAGPDGTVDLWWYPEFLRLIGPSDLASSQLGYSADASGARLLDWPHSWLVIATLCDDPVIADLSSEQIPVMVAMHGVGRWEPAVIAPSLSWFLWCLETISAVLVKIGAEAWVDDDALRINEAVCQAGIEIRNELGREVARRWVVPGWSLDGELECRPAL